MQFNIYDLCEPRDSGMGKIRASVNPKMRDLINSNIKHPTKIAKEIGISYPLLWEYINRKPSMPLNYIQKLEHLLNIDLRTQIISLEFATGGLLRKSGVICDITPTLSKVLGALAADGHLKQRDTRYGCRWITHYEMVLREEYKSTVEAFCKWFNVLFKTTLEPKPGKNHWYVYLSNKIIFRYLTKLIGFPSGRKTETVCMPRLIKEASLEIRKAFVGGVLMFDGSVNRKTGYIELYSRSKQLIIDVDATLKEMSIAPDYVKLDPDKYQRFRLIIRRREKLAKALSLFEENTEKWLRLKGCLSYKNFKKTSS